MESIFSINPILVYVHIAAGTVGLLSGAAAMALRKGSKWHIKAGNAYFISMLIMSSIGAYGAYFVPEMISVIVASLTFYLVTTAWLTFRSSEKKISLVLFASATVAILIAAAGYYFGFEALMSKTGTKDGFPYGIYLFFGSVALLAGLLDIRVIIRGGIFGKQRILRHLWRMCFSLLIATASLFLGQPQIFPESIRKPEILMIPVLLVLVALAFWLLRIMVSKGFVKTYTSPRF